MNDLKFVDENEAITLLENCELKIIQLEAELDQQRCYRKIIAERLVEIRSPRAPIARLPRELLIQVFGWVGFDNPLKIGTTLLVCKYWNSIACNSPTLWANLLIRLWPDPEAIQRQSQFVESAVTFSREALLDIELHLPERWDLWSHLACKMLSISQPRTEKDEEDCDRMERWFDSVHTGEGYPLLFYLDIDAAISNHIRLIAGEDGRNLHRIRSLNITFHSTDFLDWIDENFFHYEMPMLEQLVIQTYDDEPDVPEIFHYPAPRLARIATNVNLAVNELVTTEGQLTHLAVVLNESSYDLFPDSRFTRNLTHLYISQSLIGGWMPSQRGSDFHFPVLRDLALSGGIPVEFITAPQLTSLRLCDWRTCDAFLDKSSNYPRLERLHLWSGAVDVEEVIIPHVLQLPHLTELGFLSTIEDILHQCLDQVKKSALLKNLVVKGFTYYGSMFEGGFEVYNSNPSVEIKL